MDSTVVDQLPFTPPSLFPNNTHGLLGCSIAQKDASCNFARISNLRAQCVHQSASIFKTRFSKRFGVERCTRRQLADASKVLDSKLFLNSKLLSQKHVTSLQVAGLKTGYCLLHLRLVISPSWIACVLTIKIKRNKI